MNGHTLMQGKRINRRQVVGGLGVAPVAVALGAVGSAPRGRRAAAQSGPVSLTIIDVAGNLQLTRDMIEEYLRENPDVVSNVAYTTATAPELASRIQAQQNADRVDISLVLTGSDGLSAGIELDLFTQLLPEYADRFPDLEATLVEPAAQELAEGYGINLVFGNYGPTFTFNPEQVEQPPTSPQELMDYASANSGQFMYARPANSGPGRSFLMGLPYVLEDSDPRDPENGWENTWAYLEELGQYIDYYPAGTTPTMQELGQGSRSMVASTMGWDMNPRVLGTVPVDFGVTAFDSPNLVADAQYGAIPQGLDEERLEATLGLLNWMLTPEQQAKAYDQGYFYPGPAVAGVTLDMAPEASQEAVNSVLRPEFDEMIANSTIHMPLDATSLVRAFEIWDERIGAA